ncbi:cell division regulator GpsB [Terribacillus saccharophilus]|jgi:DivIVA domain-containing protein|uniref:Cell cycle protein GpsB n=1 Tax=Terribacillus saccharophilus TaxID=361277 RepID=A0A075LL13_9BACI|nr:MULTISPECIES: cell division regulator GpsB [Terribacillus]AIF66612.1 cell division protein DivIVA [Terribacillus goriensis]MCM3224690.1 cell division regulator GpsB [Terribacillus saccharophilus]MEC0283413.1 cell division regulator GpsB [Terribacillus saccharophilus]MEC0290369.1 cell division regulator GpsB [Terribacillus saccharophilus]MEC0304120.1 cell division regulator GpsB [Terribacillus saccharophilus]
MALANIQLTQKDIFEKNFKTGMRGYNQDEVDEYLDKIIQDYETFQKEIDRLKSENERLRQQQSSNDTTRSTRSVQQPKEQAPQPAAPVRERETQMNHQVNYDILKRLSNLEKAVFGKKFAENDV